MTDPRSALPGVPSAQETPSAAEGFDDITSAELRAAATRIAGAWSSSAPEEWEEAEVRNDLAVLLHALEAEPGAAPPIATGFRSAFHQRLLERLRSEVVQDWLDRPTPPDSAAMLDTLAAFEHVQQSLDPGWDEHFASQLMGPDGLKHLMEIAHDLRSPLTSILFLAETLRRGQSGDVNDVQHRQLGIVYSAAMGLTSVLSDVIELARGGNRLMEKEPSPLSVTEALESVRDIIRPLAEEKGLEVRIEPPHPDERLGYPVALSRVLLNLTTNALKFTDEGFVEIVARPVSATRVEFAVRDTGSGMRPELLKDLFRPFRRSRVHEGLSFSGTGLGLAICRRLVEAMGSELRIETDPAWGTRFFFELELPPIPPR